MSDYPAGSTAKQYFDTEGNILTLRQLIRAEPEWAHSRIVEFERLEQQLAELREAYEAAAIKHLGTSEDGEWVSVPRWFLDTMAKALQEQDK